VLAKPATPSLLADQIIDSLPKPQIEYDILQDITRLAELYEAFKVAAGFGERNRDV
jgi:hypothetical protein